MALRRSLLAAAAGFVVVLALGVSQAAAARPVGYPKTITTAHFVVHYTGDLLDPDQVTDQTAADVAAIAENAYVAETQAYGYPTPLSDGAVIDPNNPDARIDIWVKNTGVSGTVGLTVEDNPGAAQTSGYIVLDPNAGLTQPVVARELFHLIEDGIWANVDSWFTAASTEWMGFRFEGFLSDIDDTTGPPDMSLDCTGGSCAPSSFEQDGYSRWPFFQYLSEHFGSAIVKDILNQGFTTGNPAITDISAVLSSKGTTLGDTFTNWALANMDGGYQPTELQKLPPITYATLATGISSATLSGLTVAVNHLAARYVAFDRGDGKSDHPCYAATLSLAVGLPAGVNAKPYFYWSAPGNTPMPLTISGSQATITVPWDTCAWGYSGYLLLPNPSTGTDGALFSVNETVTVDVTKPASSSFPPPAIPVWGPVVPAAGDRAPQLNVYSPELIRVSAKTRLLRLIVFASGGGQLRATLGTSLLGTSTLRPGSNDVRFVLPRSLVSHLRSTSGSQLLQLTSLSPAGATGATVTRHVTVQHPKPKKKPAPRR